MEQAFFEFTSYEFDTVKKKAFFSYRLGSPTGEIYDFTETLTFPDVPELPVNQKLLDKAMQAVHMALGISYYKLYCPTDLRIPNYSLSKEQAVFWGIIYRESEIMQLYHGFELKVEDKGRFPFDQKSESSSIDASFEDRALVLFGGGKDSLVSYDLLQKAGEPSTFFNFGRFILHDVVSTKLETPRIVVDRELDPLLFELNKREDVYSGRRAHVPIPTMIAFVAVLSAILYDYRYIVFSNESSADIGNIMYEGVEVNHQWSKSIRAEKLIQDYIKKNISSDLSCFSFLRPFHEIWIVEKFAQNPQYFHMFSSCNRNFALVQQEITTKLWCCECEKCAFVWVLLSAFISKEELISIFGENLYEKESLLQTFKDLLGVGVMKPLECVGTPEETIVAMYMASQKGEYKSSVVMDMFDNEVLPTVKSIDDLKIQVFKYGDDSLIPEKFKKILS